MLNRFALLSSLAFIAALVLSGCGGSDPADELGSCEMIGTVDIGSVTATTPQGSFSTSCGIASVSNGFFQFIVREPNNDSPLGGETFEILTDGITAGTYPVGSGDGTASLTYGTTPASTIEATSGSITITSTSGGFNGTFAFTTATGVKITNGRFQINP